MTITPSDIKVLSSAAMTDAYDAGGFMGSVAVQDGAENNTFPDLSSMDRVFGRLQLRKVYPFIQTATTDVLLGANLIVEDEPDDSNIASWVFAAADEAEQRSQAIDRLQQSHWAPSSTQGNGVLEWADAAMTKVRGSSAALVTTGSVLYSADGSGGWVSPVLVTAPAVYNSGDNTYSVTYTGVGYYNAGAPYMAHGMPSNATPRLHATAAATGALLAGATSITVDSVLVPIVPVSTTDVPGDAGTIGIDAAAITPQGRAVGFRGGDAVVVHHSAEVAPATYSNGATINCGRSPLSRAVLVDANGKTLTSGYTVDLAAGVITVTNTTGWAQPVKARHTIEDVVGLQRTGYPELRQTSTAGSGVKTAGPYVLSEGLVMYCGRTNVGQIKVYSKTGQDLDTYVQGGVLIVNLAAGTVQINGAYTGAPLASFVTSHSPVTLVASGSSSTVAVVPTAPQANPNVLTLNRGLSRAFPAGTLVSSALLLGDMQARVGVPWAQETWQSIWSGTRDGAAIVGQYDHAGRPILVTNDGAVTDRWALEFTSPTTFRCISEQRGQVATGDVNTAFAPVNPATGKPFFTLSQFGWGAGWKAGNVLRFDTSGASAPVWVARVTLPSAPTDAPDSLTLAVRGDIDA